MKKGVLLIFLLSFIRANAWQNDSVAYRNNLVKINLSSHVLYSTSWIFGFERVLPNGNSIGISGGYLEFPDLLSNDSIVTMRNNIERSGYTLGAEYRFYLNNLNRHKPPRGVYLGPYCSYYHFFNDRNMSMTGDAGNTDFNLVSRIGIFNIGFQLGYQFIIKDRWCLDFVFAGPSLSSYRFNLNSDTQLDVDTENELVRALIARFPLLGEFIRESEVSVNKTTVSWGPGYRYLFQVGYKFGLRKNKNNL